MALRRGAGFCIRLGTYIANDLKNDKGRRGFKRFLAPTILEMNRRAKKVDPLPIEKSRRSNFIEWNYNAEIFAFGKRLGEEFNIELLLQAFVHRSYIVQEEMKQAQVGIEKPSLGVPANDDLARSGQQIISAQVRSYLSHSLPRFPLEGINALHDYLLSDETLGNISKNLGTTDIILSADYPVEVSTYAKTFKAIVGALAESQSTERANLFVRDFVLTTLAEVDVNDFYEIPEPLKVLTDILARDKREPPEPRLIGQSAMNEILATYTVGIYSNKQLIGQGPGESVDVAVEMAARDALKRLFKTTDASKPLRFDIQVTNTNPNNLKIMEWRSSAFENQV